MSVRILDGLRVVDLTQNVAGPFCSQILADLGAEVVKIERPDGGDDTRAWRPPEIGGQSAIFLALNRGKRSMAVDLSAKAGQEIIGRLAAGADIFIHSMRPGSAERLGLGHSALKAGNPRLVYCAISAFGNAGPMRGLPGYDPLVQAFSGIMSVTGNEGDDPVRVNVSLVDMGSGMWAALGIVSALLERSRTGVGGKVEASLLDTALSWMTVPFSGYFATGVAPRKMGSAMSMAAPYELFRSADGYVFIGAGNDRLFARVCAALGCPNLGDDPRFATNTARVAARAQLHSELEALTVQRATVDLVETLRRHGAPCSELNDVPATLAHEQVVATGMIADLPIRSAPHHKVVRLPLLLDGERCAATIAPPDLGSDTQAILDELGYDAAEIALFREKRIVA
jgi:crotonobetainyl-CoA:carnitine CoA-transferase CaiB-like acyl-CoA transferase